MTYAAPQQSWCALVSAEVAWGFSKLQVLFFVLTIHQEPLLKSRLKLIARNGLQLNLDKIIRGAGINLLLDGRWAKLKDVLLTLNAKKTMNSFHVRYS